MKIWKTVAQNVLSGCVGAALVMGSAQAQKAASKPAPQYEIRVQRLMIVDGNNKERGVFEKFGEGAALRIQSGKASVFLSTFDPARACLQMSAGDHRHATIEVSDYESALKMFSGSYSTWLAAGNDEVEFTLLQGSKGSHDKIPPMPKVGSGRPLNLHAITATVGDDRSSLTAFGPRSAISVGGTNTASYAGLEYDTVNTSGSLYASGTGGYLAPAFACLAHSVQ
jgi:hypothetical protein